MRAPKSRALATGDVESSVPCRISTGLRSLEAWASGDLARQAALSQTIGKYRDLISATVRGNTRLPDNLKGNPQVRCLVKLLPTGDVVSVRVTQSSGNPAYDEAVVRAIENLKLAMRMRLSREPLTEQQAHAFAAVLDSAAQQLERI